METPNALLLFNAPDLVLHEEMKALLVFLFLLSPMLHAKPYCERTPRDFRLLALEPDQRIAIRNQGGINNTGVCWWHSKLQRYAIYLAQYAPEKSKPTTVEAKVLIERLRKGKGVVIPGYSGFKAFTADFPELVKDELEDWQRREGVVDFAWLRGLKDRPRHDPDQLARFMKELFENVELRDQIVFVKLQLKGIPAHSWLITQMEVLPQGFKLGYVDSNFPDANLSYEYRYGDTILNAGFGEMGIYEEYGGGLKKARSEFQKTCSGG